MSKRGTTVGSVDVVDFIRNNHWTSRLCKSTRGTAIGLVDDDIVQEEQSLDQ